MKDDLLLHTLRLLRDLSLPKGIGLLFPPSKTAGKAYYEFRAQLMVANNAGMTKTYNRFHEPNDNNIEITKLRDLACRHGPRRPRRLRLG